MTKPQLSILLPSRGRTDQLKRSLDSLCNNADNPSKIELLLAFDDDDKKSSQYFVEKIAPGLLELGCQYKVYEFPRLGYARLNEYLNALGKSAQSDWWVFWNDDAVMINSGWDTTILAQENRFCIQAFDTHNKHPYSIFPIVPRAWFDLLGHLSQHPLNDAYISQIAWLLDIMVQIPVQVDHQRFDLTGDNMDKTFMERNVLALEGNPARPQDFNHAEQRKLRMIDANKIAMYLGEQGYDMSFWNDVAQKKRDPWDKMLAADVNKQMIKFAFRQI
jgi:glycosyltransferase involved in cell wall biosynthesis